MNGSTTCSCSPRFLQQPKTKIAMLLRRNSHTRTAKVIAISALFAVLVNTMAFSRIFTSRTRSISHVSKINGMGPAVPTSLNVLNTPSASPLRGGGPTPIKIEKNLFGTSSSSSSSSTSTSSSSSSSSSSTITNTTTNNNTPQEKKLIRPLVVCGPSGVGKGTIIGKYMSDYGGDDKFAFTVSHTTRSPRPGEVDGIHYHFTDVTSIKAAIDKHEFLEYAEVHGNWYGTSLDSLSFVQDSEKKLPILDIDIQGVKSIKAWQKRQRDENDDGDEGTIEENDGLPELDAKYIFIAPPSLEVLKQRLVARGTETEESIERRTKNAVAEMEYGMEEGNFDAVVVNDDLDKACQNFSNVIDRLYAS